MINANGYKIFEIWKPGTFLDYEDNAFVNDIGTLLDGIIDSFYEANASLNLFDLYRRHGHHEHNLEQWRADMARRTEIVNEMDRERGLADPLDCLLSLPTDKAIDKIFNRDWIGTSVEASARLKVENWKSGRTSQTIDGKYAFIAAKSFLYSLDTLEKIFGIICKIGHNDLPDALPKLHSNILKEFPDLRGVRNTSHHKEDRIRGLEGIHKKRKIIPKPIKTGLVIGRDYEAFFIDVLDENRFGATMADGEYGEVEVSIESLEKLQIIVQDSLDSFKWRGVAIHYPD